MTYTKGQRSYRRRLGDAEPDEAPAGYMAGFTGVKRTTRAVAAASTPIPASASPTWITRAST